MAATIQDVADRSFDYVIAGGGTAGLTLAAKLTENPDISVLVLEAGEAHLSDPLLLLCGQIAAQFGNDHYDWQHPITKQKAINDRSMIWTRGKCLGGSSAINFMNWTVPPREHLDDWEKLGNPGWNFDSIMGASQRLVRFIEPPVDVQKKFKLRPEMWKALNREGDLAIAYQPTMHHANIIFHETLEKVGISPAQDPYNGDPKGYATLINTYDPRTHTRSYATPAFYIPNRHRSNLTVLTCANVCDVITEAGPAGLTAVGVHFLYERKLYTVKARKEVILSAGTLKSPQILELSGIGRRDVLEKIGVPVKVELPGVGENLQDHPMCGLSWELRDDVDIETLNLLRDPETRARHLELLKEGKGLFTVGIVNAAFETLDKVSPNASAIYERAKAFVESVNPEGVLPSYFDQMQIQLDRIKPGEGSPITELIMSLGMFTFPNPPIPGKRYMTVICLNHNYMSRGTIHAASKDPLADPINDPHLFAPYSDFELMVETLKFARNMGHLSPLKELIAREHNPGPEVKTDEDFVEFVRDTCTTAWHAAGSCSMLPKDKGGVVDTNLKVYGTTNLRVVDLSVMPLEPATHTQSIAYGIAGRAAEIISRST